MENKKVSVVVPTYNESGNIGKLIEKLIDNVSNNLYEVIVVDDNSNDGTQEKVKALQEKIKNLRLVVRKNEKGLPSAIWRGIQESKGNVVVWLDSDLSHPPEYIPKMLSYIGEYDIVCASRYVDQGKDDRSFIRILASLTINIMARILLGLKVKDLTSGFYAVKKEVFSKVTLMQTGFAEYCIRFTYDSVKKGYQIKEMGYVSPDRKEGVSKTQRNFSRFIRDGYLCLREMVRIRLGIR